MKKVVITKKKAVELFGTQAELARALDITRSAVGQWGWKDPIPDAHAMRIYYELRPEAFRA